MYKKKDDSLFDDMMVNLKGDLNQLVKDLYQRDKRNDLFEEDFWQMVPLLGVDNPTEILQRVNHDILNNAPHMVDFHDRAKIFNVVMQKSLTHSHIFPGMEDGYLKISRNNLYEDAYNKILMMGEEFRGNYQITFIDNFGQQEEGVDGGGLFKEFIQDVLKLALSDAYGFFIENTEDRTYYPNPRANEIEGYDSHFRLIGMIVGKTLQRGMLLNCEFSQFFLNLIVGNTNTLNQLKYLDKEIYDNLIFLKNYEGDAKDLMQTFAHEYRSSDNIQQSINLIPNGSNIYVDNHNKLTYI
jgi:ubiquitin-protein ligase E3 C